MTSVISLAEYNKVVEQKNYLSQTLIKLQDASRKALKEYSDLKEKHSTALNEINELKSQLIDLHQKHTSMETKLKEKSNVLKQVMKASKAAVAEFNELKQRLSDERDKRKQAETALLLQQRSTAKTDESSDAQRELVTLRIQLRDTVEEFIKFKDLASAKNNELEQRIEREVKHLEQGLGNYSQPNIKGQTGTNPKSHVYSSTDKSTLDSGGVRPNTVNSRTKPSFSSNKNDPPPIVPQNLLAEIRSGTTLNHVEPKSDKSKNQIFLYPQGGFGDLGALIAKSDSNSNLKELLLKTSQELVDTVSPSKSTGGHTRSTSMPQKSSEFDPQGTFNNLMESTRNNRAIFEKSLSRLQEVTGKSRDSSHVSNAHSSLLPQPRSRPASRLEPSNSQRTSIAEIQDLFDELEKELGVKL